MKMRTIIMAVAAGLTLQVMAAGPEANPSASTSVHKNTVQQRVYNFLAPAVTKTDKIERLGGISSRPWAQTAASAASATSFAGNLERDHNVQFNLFWFGARPD